MDARAWNAPSGRGTQEGFTLIEVIVALMLMSIVLMAGGGFMIRSISAASTLSGRQGAVTVANEALEQIRAVKATFDSDLPTRESPLVYGRGKSAVAAQWAASGLDLTDTYTGSGSTTFDADTYTTSGTPTVPFQQTITRDQLNYTVDALIGTCVRVDNGADCTEDTVGTELFRVVIRVTWTPGPGHACSGGCSYVLSTLIDPTTNPEFNASRKPVANPDSATVVTGSSVNIGVTANDSGEFAISGAVTLLTAPASGTTSVTSNIVKYVSVSGFSGTVTFTYSVTDVTDRTSTPGTVTVNVTPVAVNDTAATVTVGSAAFLTNVVGNDKGTGLSLVSVAAPSIGTATVSGTQLRYTPPTAASGVATMVYNAQDSSGQPYTGTLTLTIRPTSTTICWAGWVTSGSASLKTLLLASPGLVGTGPFTVGSPLKVAPSPAAATVTASGTSLTYSLPASATLPQTITYVVTDGTGTPSTAVTMTLKGSCP